MQLDKKKLLKFVSYSKKTIFVYIIKNKTMKITEKQIQQKIKQLGLSREEAIRSIKVGEKLKQRLQNRF